MKLKAPYLVLALAAVPAIMSGQSDGSTSTPRTGTSLLRLEGVSAYSGYYTSGMPVGFEVPSQTGFLGPTALAAVSASVGGGREREKSTVTWSYSPSYFSTVYSSGNLPRRGSLNHRGNIDWRRKLTSKWTLSAAANVLVASLQQLYFTPGLLSNITAIPLSYDDLTAAILAGQVTDAQLAAMLTGASLPASPEQAFIYGNRLLSSSASATLAWAPSGRTTVALTLTGTRSQHLDSAGTDAGGVAAPAFVPKITTAGVGLSWSYSLSPRTHINIGATSTRTFSTVQLGYASRATVSLGRTLSRRWFAKGQAGAGGLVYSRQVYATPSTWQYLFGGELGFKTSSHTFIGTYDRTLGDVYGLGSGTSTTAGGAWNWRRPGSGWSLTASMGHQTMNNAAFPNTTSWRAQAGLEKALGRQFALGWQYIYLEFPGNLRASGFHQTEHGMMASISWQPPQYR